MKFIQVFGLACFAMQLGACTSLGSSGPQTGAVTKADGKVVLDSRIKLLDLSDGLARQVAQAARPPSFSETIGDGIPYGSMIGKGDVLDIAIWEAPPATLFGSGGGDPRMTSSTSTARGTAMPEQMVDSNGQINVPFVGEIRAAGRTPQQIERELTNRLKGLAHMPQVIVRIVRNATSNVTVVGEVANSTRLPLTPKGERLLDALASAGGVRQPIGKMTVQVTRGDRVVSMPLEGVIRDPVQNIRLQPDDVVTAYYQPFSFTALGAIGNNAEVNFEGTGITLAQALGRIGGLRDDRANVKGVFVFRFEEASALGGTAGRVPVIYRLNLADPANFFVAQSFQVRDKDVLYVSNAPGTDLQKFVNIVSSMAFSVVGITNSIQ